MKKILFCIAFLTSASTGFTQWTTSGSLTTLTGNAFIPLGGKLGIGTNSFPSSARSLQVFKSFTGLPAFGAPLESYTTGFRLTHNYQALVSGPYVPHNYDFSADANRFYLTYLSSGITTPLMSISKTGNIGFGTTGPNSKLDIRMGNEEQVILQSNVPNTYTGISFRHSDGTENWRFRAFSNFPGGYGNMFSLVGSSGGDFWISAGKTLIGNFFDFTSCTDCNNYSLFVKKGIRTERVKVDIASGVWADYVFKKDYNLMPLAQVELFINNNQHLPGVPASAEVEKEGLDLGEMNAKLLEKIEELTLHLIQQEKRILELETKFIKP